MTTVVNLRRDAYDAYIGRAGKGQPGTFGNPYSVQEHGQNALKLFDDYFKARVATDMAFREKVMGLKDKRLGCFCRPAKGFQGAVKCHGQLIVSYIEGIPPQDVP